MESWTEVRTAREGRGLEGDRYARAAGHWARHRSEPVTLVSAEALEEVSIRLGRSVDPALVRRNVVTRGVTLDSFVGRVFRVGEVVLEGTRPCDPCRYLEELAGIPGLLEGLVGRGGLRATIRMEGTIRVGDPVELVEPAPASSG
jgi:MOSC domain-containing protein YiiM